MNIELSKPEIELLDKALQTWETEATSSAVMGSMFSMILAPEGKRDEAEDRSKVSMEKATKENQSRRIQATLLRAKLFQGLNRESEFSCEAPSVHSA